MPLSLPTFSILLTCIPAAWSPAIPAGFAAFAAERVYPAPAPIPARQGLPAFLDAPAPALREVYARKAANGTPRDCRLYGELLLNEGDAAGFPFVSKAAGMSDARAAYIVAEALAYGLWGQAQDYTSAMKWLHAAMSADYAPAYELMSALSWDGAWDCLRNTHDAIWYLDKAITVYMSDEVPDPALQAELAAYVKTLRQLRASMNRVKDYNWDKLGQYIPQLKGFMPSYIQLRLSTFPDTTDEGLRRRLVYIQALMEQRRDKFKIAKLGAVRQELLPVSATGTGDDAEIARTLWRTTDSTFSACIELNTDALPPAPDLQDPDFNALRKSAFRLVVANDALAHELAHVYFCSRYPKLADLGGNDGRMTYEGHATNAAYEFTNETFFVGTLSPERYADFFLPEEYREYFFWFRENCLTPDGCVDWAALDRWERNSGGSGYRPRTRTHSTSGKPAAATLKLFGKAFPGYM